MKKSEKEPRIRDVVVCTSETCFGELGMIVDTTARRRGDLIMGWTFLTCVHGRQEGLDSHDCDKCQAIARAAGWDMSNGRTYIFTTQKQVKDAEKEAKTK